MSSRPTSKVHSTSLTKIAPPILRLASCRPALYIVPYVHYLCTDFDLSTLVDFFSPNSTDTDTTHNTIRLDAHRGLNALRVSPLELDVVQTRQSSSGVGSGRCRAVRVGLFAVGVNIISQSLTHEMVKSFMASAFVSKVGGREGRREGPRDRGMNGWDGWAQQQESRLLDFLIWDMIDNVRLEMPLIQI